MIRALPVLFLAVGCRLPEPEPPQLLVPEDVEVPWDASFDATDDGRIALVPVDVMLYDAASGEPIADEAIEVTTPAAAASILAPASILSASPDEPLADWDVWRDRFVVIDAGWTGSLRFRTDASGLVRLYVAADGFGGEPVPVVVATAETDDTFLLVPR